jgi:hypothetical protein
MQRRVYSRAGEWNVQYLKILHFPHNIFHLSLIRKGDLCGIMRKRE